MFPNMPTNANNVVLHRHGGLQPADSDGAPDQIVAPGGSRTNHYPNDQAAAPLWYHDHADQVTSYNVYAGLAGFMPNTDRLKPRTLCAIAPVEEIRLGILAVVGPDLGRTRSRYGLDYSASLNVGRRSTIATVSTLTVTRRLTRSTMYRGSPAPVAQSLGSLTMPLALSVLA
jgi:hypothetical protein